MKKFFIALLLWSSVSIAQTITPIADLKVNNSSGVPLGNGQVFTVEGVVTCSNQFGNAGPGAMQDETGGISVYGALFANGTQIGDSVRVRGTLTHFNGLTQIDVNATGSTVQVLSSGHSFDTLIVTLQQITSQQWNGYEEFEGQLIRVNNVTISGSGNFASGTNYTITDPTGTITSGFRIDNDVSSIIGTPIPTGQIDVVAILGQYKFGAPYNSGYQVMPRFISDLIFDGSPTILNPVFASNITSDGFTVYFNTARHGNSQVKYGLTQNLELDSVIINNDTTVHVVPVSGLQPGTLYYYKALSTNEIGTSSSLIQNVTTQSDDPSVGTINIYFNFSVDTSVAIPGNAAKGSVNFEQKLIERINAANHSIDLALYSFFNMQNIANALVVAKNRGVKVRVVYDNRTTQNSMQTLLSAGIQMSQRPSNLSGIMHNKFFVFDARDTIPSNDWVWTGSWNVTSAEVNWKNNVIEINDPAIASAYTIEFEEMWGSNGDTPNSSTAKFGSQKSDNTQHIFNVGGKDVELYFSPSDGTTQKIINSINSADSSIYMALFVVTRADIRQAIQNRFNAGVTDIRGIVDNINTTGSQYQNLASFAEMYQNVSPTLHHKYGIVDASYPWSNPIVITGSHNWSSAAENDNDENTLLIKDINIANQYMQEFKKRYNEAGGTGTFVIPFVTNIKGEELINEFSYHLFQNYPNPFNPVTTIRFSLPKEEFIKLELFNSLGQKVNTLFEGLSPAGIVAVDVNAKVLSSGIYYYRIQAGEYISTKKMMLMK